MKIVSEMRVVQQTCVLYIDQVDVHVPGSNVVFSPAGGKLVGMQCKKN